MNMRHYLIFWGVFAALFIAAVVLFKSVLLPFVLGGAIAYLLNPVIEKLSAWRLSRPVAIILILALFFVAVLAVGALVLPVAYRELIQFVSEIPSYIERLWDWAEPLSRRIQDLTGQDIGDLRQNLGRNAGQAADVAKGMVLGLMAGGAAVAHSISVIVFTPIIAYFFMREWPVITQWVRDLMPRDQKDTIQDLLDKINRKLAGFIRGQLSVVMILAVFYALALSIVGLKYGFLIGLCAGLLSVIPMVGSTIGLLVGVLVAWFQFHDWGFVALIAGIFLGGQFVEGNFLTPKLVGESVGMHPLWVLFALVAGGSLFGILGMFLAVPVAAVIGVLAAFAIARYKASPYYKGTSTSKRKTSYVKKRPNAK